MLAGTVALTIQSVDRKGQLFVLLALESDIFRPQGVRSVHFLEHLHGVIRLELDGIITLLPLSRLVIQLIIRHTHFPTDSWRVY